jgi:hypothetical protein
MISPRSASPITRRMCTESSLSSMAGQAFGGASNTVGRRFLVDFRVLTSSDRNCKSIQANPPNSGYFTRERSRTRDAQCCRLRSLQDRRC